MNVLMSSRSHERLDEEGMRDMNETAVMPEVKTLKIIVKVVNIICPCGGNCEDENGDRAIGFLDKIVWCRLCGKRYEVPVEAFPKFEHVISCPCAEMEYRTKVTLANATEQFAGEAYAHNYGVCQSVGADHWVSVIYQADSVKSPYLRKRLEDTNGFIDRLLGN